MYLTFTFKVSDAKNDDGQGRLRRQRKDKVEKGQKTTHRLSNRKKAILLATARAFSQAYQQLVQWGMANWDSIPFTFPVSKDGQPVLDREGKQKFALTSAHYLANWLSGRVNLSKLELHSRLVNGARNQAAETLLSQFRLRQVEKTQPNRLTGSVGEVNERSFDREELAESFRTALEDVRKGETDEVPFAKLEPIFLPILFSGPADFPLFRHCESKRLFVCLPLLSRSSGLVDLTPGVVRRNNQMVRLSDKLVPLREDDSKIPNSPQWLILPLEHQRSLSNQRNAEEMLSEPEIKPRTAELRFKDDSWHFNIVVEMPEPEPINPEAYLGVHIGYYGLWWNLVGRTGQILKEGTVDLSHLKNVILEAARQRSYARKRMRSDRFPRYRGILRVERERALRQLLAIAKESRAVIGIEEISGVEKSTWFGQVNLFRSHWDFGKDVDILTYRSALAGLPLVRRGRKKELFQVGSFRAMFTCSACWFTNAGKLESERLVALEDGQVSCANCNCKTDRDKNASRVVAMETRNFFEKRR